MAKPAKTADGETMHLSVRIPSSRRVHLEALAIRSGLDATKVTNAFLDDLLRKNPVTPAEMEHARKVLSGEEKRRPPKARLVLSDGESEIEGPGPLTAPAGPGDHSQGSGRKSTPLPRLRSLSPSDRPSSPAKVRKQPDR